MEYDQALPPGKRLSVLLRLHQIDSEGLNQLAILHAAGASRFTSSAIEAQIQMAFYIFVQWNAAINHAPHEIDAATGRIHLRAQFYIRWTCCGTKATVNAIEKEFIVDPLADITCRASINGG